MNDRELLELAAKASGIKGEWGPVLQLVDCSDMFMLLEDGSEEVDIWNPLENDGDALRLAVKIGMTVSIDNTNGDVESWNYEEKSVSVAEKIGNDPYAATRRAIVRVAAEIGKQM